MTLACFPLAVTAVLSAGALSAFASPIPYSSVGTPAAAVQITATATGQITGYFVDSYAGDTNQIGLLNLTTGVMSSYFFNDHTTAGGAVANFGSVTLGDKLVFVLDNLTTGTLLRSDASNPDSIAHAYLSPFSGGLINGQVFPAGMYVGFEDLLRSPSPQKSDLDYNDDNFIFTNVAASPAPVPEPSTLALLGTGAAGLFGAVRRRLSRS